MVLVMGVIGVMLGGLVGRHLTQLRWHEVGARRAALVDRPLQLGDQQRKRLRQHSLQNDTDPDADATAGVDRGAVAL